jgi:hypothetical protein
MRVPSDHAWGRGRRRPHYEPSDRLLTVASPDFTTWAALAGTWILVIGTLAFAYWQMRQTRRINSAQTILDLRDRFDRPAMRAARLHLSTQLLAGDATTEIEDFEVGLFFQLMGSLTRDEILDPRMVWNAFGPWVTGYYYFLTHPVDRIARWREESHDPLIFREFEWLAKEMDKLDRSTVHPPAGVDTTRQDARDLLESETRFTPSA